MSDGDRQGKLLPTPPSFGGKPTPAPVTYAGELFTAEQLAGVGRLHWRGTGEGVGRRFELYRGDEPQGVHVIHCGHPTALRPWYIEPHCTDRKFKYLDDAQAKARAHYEGAKEPLRCPRCDARFHWGYDLSAHLDAHERGGV